MKCKKKARKSGANIVEKFIGDDYRLLVINVLVAAAKRTLHMLLAMENLVFKN